MGLTVRKRLQEGLAVFDAAVHGFDGGDQPFRAGVHAFGVVAGQLVVLLAIGGDEGAIGGSIQRAAL